MECIEHNLLCKHIKEVISSQDAVLVMNWVKHSFSLWVLLKSLIIYYRLTYSEWILITTLSPYINLSSSILMSYCILRNISQNSEALWVTVFCGIFRKIQQPYGLLYFAKYSLPFLLTFNRSIDFTHFKFNRF